MKFIGRRLFIVSSFLNLSQSSFKTFRSKDRLCYSSGIYSVTFCASLAVFAFVLSSMRVPSLPPRPRSFFNGLFRELPNFAN
ncbi:hypothetical protein Gasu2_68990 [Galdieria sulphuraria]|nr:hypothetical protein Gasu2_68990 [Galdieria sulphuraria]